MTEEIWTPRFKLGDKVILKFDRARPNCRIVRESDGPGDQAGVQWGKDEQWWNNSSVFESEMEALPPQDGSYLDPIEATWNTAYPDRSLWQDIGDQAQNEWRRVFSIYEQFRDTNKS